MNSSISYFGIGCFHFSIAKDTPSGIYGEQYLTYLRTALEKAPNTSNLKILAGDEFLKEEFAPRSKFRSIRESPRFFPPASSDLEVVFDLFIPERLQLELHPHFHQAPDCGERMRVRILYNYYLPFVAVQPLEPREGCSPSDLVAVTREFLEKHFDEDPESPLAFDYLGPSPFHADFVLRPREDAEQRSSDADFDFHRLSRRGYDLVTILFDPSRFGSSDEALEELLHHLDDDFGLYYFAQHLRQRQMLEWSDIADSVTTLVQLTKASGLRAIWNNLFRIGRVIQELVVGLTDFESSALLAEYQLQRGLQDLSKGRARSILRRFVDEAIRDQPKFPISPVRELTSLLEQRRSKTGENALLLLSAVLGGAVGSIITLLISAR
ncbi:MAG: hypothetical protein WD906_06205 [Anaerolineales bacterium]